MIICENTAMKKGACYMQVPFRYAEVQEMEKYH